MIKLDSGVRFLFYSVWAVLMTALTYILGGASLKILRRKSGRWIYWGLTVALSAALFAAQYKMLAFAYLSLVLLMGVFAELEDLGLGLNASAFFTLVINSVFWAGGFLFWISLTGPKWFSQILAGVETVLKSLEAYNPGLQLKAFELTVQLPSIVLMMWMASLYLALLLESRLDREREVTVPSMREQLKEFRVPDAAVWIFIVALLGKFGGLSNQVLEAVSANALNVCFMIFFFQGIAVVGRFFEKMRMNTVLQTVFTILIVVYLFLFVSVLGLMDYWFDFRGRLAKDTGQFERET